MTQEDKELLLKDLSARLPYGVKCVFYSKDGYIPSTIIKIDIDNELVSHKPDGQSLVYVYPVEEIISYLRPISSMTEEEKQEMSDGSSLAFESALNGISGYCPETMAYSAFNVDFCLTHHLDYRGLIKKGLALEAPEGMYKTE